MHFLWYNAPISLLFSVKYGMLFLLLTAWDDVRPERGHFMHLQESGEMYLETIYVLSKKNKLVRSIDVCEYMGYSKPSVSRAMGILKKGGYVVVDGEGHLSLTDAGLEVAQTIYERHTTLTDFLIRLGVDKDVAAEDACKMEHDISNETFAAMKRHAQQFQNQTN